jgi:hypothetical protein
MAEINAQQTTRTLIAYTLSTDKNALLALLKRNGIELPINSSDKEVSLATLKALKSLTFKNDMTALLGKKVESAKNDFAGFTGVDDFAGISDLGYYFNAAGVSTSFGKNVSDSVSNKSSKQLKRVSETNPKGKTGVGLFLQNLGKSLSSQETINAGLGIGLTALNNKVQTQNNNLNQEANQIVQQSDAITKTLPAAQQKSNTLTYVFVGVGVLALIGIVYFVAKKK